MSDDTFVSQLHARVFQRESQAYVEDLGSTNGTYLNGNRVATATPLRRGDRLQVGSTVLEVA
jgi:pSer/pThr/pTyr-binding forkhead associated (FHA) protein